MHSIETPVVGRRLEQEEDEPHNKSDTIEMAVIANQVVPPPTGKRPSANQ
jgi:hypothetical protein